VINELSRFVIVGTLSNLANFFIYKMLYIFGLSLFSSSIIGYSVGIIISYTLGRLWVFGKVYTSSSELLISFLLIYIIGGIGMSALIVTSSNIFNLDYRASWVIGATFAFTNNFLGQKFIVFRQKRS
jgi:putative flippase GtrA